MTDFAGMQASHGFFETKSEKKISFSSCSFEVYILGTVISLYIVSIAALGFPAVKYAKFTDAYGFGGRPLFSKSVAEFFSFKSGSLTGGLVLS